MTNMSDIKSVLALLCKHLNLSINVTIKPEYFRLCKYNETSKEVNEALWSVIHILSFYAVRDKRNEVSFEEYDTLSATKLYFAFLQYPIIEFYSLSQNSSCNRTLLIALAWLLTTQNVLSIVVRVNLATSILGSECSCSDVAKVKERIYSLDSESSIDDQAKNIIFLNSRLNFNFKEIDELLAEKIKLVTQIHTATLNTNGLPHLSVSEVALIKRSSTLNRETQTSKDKESLDAFHEIAVMLNVHVKWVEKENIFYDWMATVVQEHNKSLNVHQIIWSEIIDFLSLLQNITKEKIYTTSSENSSNMQNIKIDCVSRILRTDAEIEVSNWLTETAVQLNRVKEDFQKSRAELSLALKKMLKLLPSCVAIK